MEFLFEQSRAGYRPAIGLSGLVTLGLGVDVFRQPLPLGFAELAQGVVKERGVKGNARGVKLLDNRDIQSLFREQDFHVSPPARSGNGRVEQRLGKKPARQSKRLHVRFARAFSALNAGETLHLTSGRPVDRKTSRRPAACSSRYFRLEDRRIFLERLRERGIEADRVRHACRDGRSRRADRCL